VDVIDYLYYWTDHVLYYAFIAVRAWALIDCATRKSAAFPAVDKLTKPAWLAILAIAGALGTLLGPPDYPSNVVGIFSLISLVAAAVYLADVRPAVRQVTGGR